MSVRRTTLFVAAAGAAVLMALSGCASNNSRENSSPSSGSMADRGGAPAAAPAQGGAGPQQNAIPPQGPGQGGPGAQGGQDSPPKVPDNLDVENRSIIYAGTMTVRVQDVDKAAAQAIAFATGAGGFIGGDNRERDDLRSKATLTLRVPADKFTTTLDQLKSSLGDEESRQVTAQDVTDQVVDVESRLQTAQASVDRIRALLAKAQTIGEITSLEAELARRESDLESLQARKRRLAGLTALSTITLVLLGPEAAVDKEETGVGVGLRNGWSAFRVSLEVVLTVLGWLLPWIVLVGGPIYLVIWLLRRFRPRRPAVALAVAGAGARAGADRAAETEPDTEAPARPVAPTAVSLPPFPANLPAPTMPPLMPPPGPPANTTPIVSPPSQAQPVSAPPSGAGAAPAEAPTPRSAEIARSPEPPAGGEPSADPKAPAEDH